MYNYGDVGDYAQCDHNYVTSYQYLAAGNVAQLLNLKEIIARLMPGSLMPAGNHADNSTYHDPGIEIPNMLRGVINDLKLFQSVPHEQLVVSHEQLVGLTYLWMRGVMQYIVHAFDTKNDLVQHARETSGTMDRPLHRVLYPVVFDLEDAIQSRKRRQNTEDTQRTLRPRRPSQR